MDNFNASKLSLSVFRNIPLVSSEGKKDGLWALGKKKNHIFPHSAAWDALLSQIALPAHCTATADVLPCWCSSSSWISRGQPGHGWFWQFQWAQWAEILYTAWDNPHVPASLKSAAYLIIEGGLLINEDYLCSWLDENDIVRIKQTPLTCQISICEVIHFRRIW